MTKVPEPDGAPEGAYGHVSPSSGYVVALPTPGEWVADRFQITRPLGSGGFGSVYEAWQESMGHRRVALKILAPRNAHEPRAIERFRQEALLASRLSHPNTITLFDFGATPSGLFYIAMEYLNGEPLSDVLIRTGPLSVERAEHVTKQILRSLAEAHSIGLIHRDLKPDNIFLCKIFGEQDFVKVLDFGLAKIAGVLDEGPRRGDFPADAKADLTLEGLVCGTPEFMAPEQARGQDELSPSCDVYALGLLIHTMLTGQKPFTGADPITILESQIGDPLPPLSPAISGTRLARVMDVAARKDERERYPDASAMLYALIGKLPLDPLRPDDPDEVPVQPSLRRARHQQTEQHPKVSGSAAAGGSFVVEVNLGHREELPLEPREIVPEDHAGSQLMTASPDLVSDPFDEGAEGRKTLDDGATPVARAGGAATQSTRILELVPGQLPLLGREVEVRQVLGLIRESVGSERSRVLLVEGESGVGKSRFLAEIIRILQETSDMLVVGAFFRDPRAGALSALRSLVGQLFGLDVHYATDLQARRQLRPFLRERLRSLNLVLSDADLEGVARVLGVDPVHRPTVDSPHSTLDLIRKVMVDLSKEQPMLVVLEDIQYADPASLDLILALVRDVTVARGDGASPSMYLALSHRKELERAELMRVLDSLAGLGQDIVHKVQLEGLSDEACERVVDALLTVHPDLRRRIAGVAHGNPLHAIQVVQHLLDDQRLQKIDGLWCLEADSQGQMSLPADLTEMVRLRVAHMIAQSSAPEAMQELLYRLAVLGRRVPAALFRLAVSLEERPWPDSLFDRLLAELIESGVVLPTRRWSKPEELEDGDGEPSEPQDLLNFEHGLLHETLLREAEGTLAGPKMHRHAAEAKQAFYRGTPNRAAEISEHYLKAREPSMALPFLIEAADYFLGVGDLHGALSRYREADELLARDPEMLIKFPMEAHMIWVSLGAIHLRFTEYGPAQGHFYRVLNDIEHQTTRDISVAQAHHGLGEIFHHLKRYELAREHLEDAIEVARSCHNTEVEQHALIVLGEVNLAETGTVSSSYMATFEERLERLSDDRPLLKARGLQHLGRMALAATDAQVAERFFARAHMIAEELSDTNLHSSVTCDLGHALLLQRRTAEGEGKLREALASYRESSNRLGIAVTLFRLGLAAWQRGDARAALETLRQALEIRRRLPAARYLVETLALVGRVHESEGRLPEACDAYEGALKRANAPHERAGILMRLGPTLLKMRELERAQEALRRASEDLDPLRFGTELVECINLQAMAAAWRGDNAAALGFLDRSADLAESLENGPGLVFSMVATALVRWRAGEPDQGESVQRARDAAEHLNAKGIMPLVEVTERLLSGEDIHPFPEGLPSLHRAWLSDLIASEPVVAQPSEDLPV